MPEKLKLKLVSPAGSPAAVYSWPLQISDTHNEAIEIVETIRWVSKDFPDLQLAVDNNILSDFDPNDYESMKQLCDKYNKAITNIRKLWSGREPPPCINSPPSVPLLKHIMNQVYNHAIANPEDLNQYEPFSPEVYGETTFELVDHIIRKVNLGEDDIFVDLGSGVGNVVLQVASTVNCKECIGIEKAEIPSAYAQEMEKQFLKWTAWYGKSYGDFELLKGDFLSDEFTTIINKATVIFANNYVFGPTINHQLKLKFANLPDNCRIVSSREFCPLNFRITDRNLDDIGSMMRVTQLSLPGSANSVSWTNKPISFYLHVVDRSKLEEYFRRQKYPEEYPSSSTPSPDGEQDEISDNPLDRTFKSSITTEDTSDEDFDAGRYSTPQGRKELELNRLSIHKKHKARLARQRKLHPIPLKRSISIGMQKSRSVVESAKRQQKRVAKARGVQQSSRRCLDNLGNTLDLFREQMISYVQDMSQPQYTESLQKSIEKEELKNKYLHMVMTNLDSEVKELSTSTVDTMKQCMAKLGMTEFTPAGLLEGAKAIVTHNRELRNNVQQLEQSVNELQIQKFSLQRSCGDSEKRTSDRNTCVEMDRSLSSVAMDTGSCHGNESLLHIESHDPSPASSISRDLDILTSPASNIVSPTILSPRRGQNKSKHSSSSKKELEIAEILFNLGSLPTKILVTQPERIDLERRQLYSDLESCTVSVERVEQKFRHCVAPLPQEDTAQSSRVKENAVPVEDVDKRNDSSTNLSLASSITLPTNLTLALPSMLPPWSAKNDLMSTHKPWSHVQRTDQLLDKPVAESRPLDVFAPRVFNNNINKESPIVPTLTLNHGRSGSYTVTSTAVGPSSSTHVTTSIVDPVVPIILPSSQCSTSFKQQSTTTTAVSTTASSSIPRSLSNKLIIGGLSSNDASQTTSTTATTTAYKPIHHLPFSFVSNANASMADTVSSGRYVSVPPSIINPVPPSYPMSSTHVQQPHIIGARPLIMETEEDRIMLRKSHHKKRNRSSAEIGSLDTLSQVSTPEHVITPTRSQAGLNVVDMTMPPRILPSVMPTNLPSSINNDTSAVTTQPDLTKTPLLAYPYQPSFLPYMLGRPVIPTWLDMQQRLNPTSTIRPPIYPSLMQSSPLIGFDPTGTLFKPQSQFPTNLLSSPFLSAVSFGNSMDPSSLQQPPVRPFMASNPATPTSTLSPTTHSSTLPIITKESPLLHSSFTNLSSVFGGSNSSIATNRATITPPVVTSAEISPSRSGMAGPWTFPTQMSPMMGFGLGPTKFGSSSNQSSPLLGIPHTLLPGNNSPLVISQLGNLATDGGGKKDNNAMATNSHPLPDAKHSRRHHHHPPKEQLSDKSDPKHKPGVIAFVGHKPSTATGSIANTTGSSNSPVTQSDCYVVVPSPNSSTTAGSSNVNTTSSSTVTSEHQLIPRPPTSAYMQNEMIAPAVLPFQSLVSKMLVRKPRGKKQSKATVENKDGSPKKPGRRPRKSTATTSVPPIITPSVVEKLAGTPLLNVIAPSGLDVGDLPGNKKEMRQSKEALHLATLVVSEHAAKQRPRKSTNPGDLQVPTSSSRPLGEVSVSVSDTSPAKLDSACSLLTLSQTVPATFDGSHKMAAQSPVIITDKGDDSEALAQARRPSSLTAAEAMLMFTNNTAEEKSKVPEKAEALPPLPVAKSSIDVGNKPNETSDEDVIIVVQDEPNVVQNEPQVEETDNASKEEPASEEKIEENSKEDCEVNCSTATLSIPSSSIHDQIQPTNTRGEEITEKHIVSDTNHTEAQDIITAIDNIDVDTNAVSEETASNMKDGDPVSENVTLQNTEHPGTVDNDGTEVCDVVSSNQVNASNSTNNDTCSDTKSDTCGDARNDTYSDPKSDTKNDACSDTKSDMYSDTKNDTCSDVKNDTCSDTKNDTYSDTKSDICSGTKNKTCNDTKNDTCGSDTKSDINSDTKNDTFSDAKNNTSVDAKNDVCIDTKNDTCGDTKDNTIGDMKNDTYSDTYDDTTVHLNQLTVTEEVEISIDNADDGDNGNEVTAEESSGNQAMIEEESEVKDHVDASSDIDVQDNVVTDSTGDTKSNWEEVSDDELLDADLTPPLAKKSKRDDDQLSNKPPLTLNLPQTEDTGNNVTVSSEASTPLLDDNIIPARQVSVSSCISLYDEAMFEGDTFEATAGDNAETVNGDTCENGVDDSVMVDNTSKSDLGSKRKQINPTTMAHRRYRTQSIDSEGSSYGKESRKDTNTLTLPDGRQERNKSASPRRKLQPDSTTSPKDLESDYKDTVHSPADRSEWNSRLHKSRERGRNPRKQPLLHKNYGDHCERQQGGNQRYNTQNIDYRSSGRPNNTWSNSHYKHSNNNNYNNQHYSHWSTNQQQNYPSEQDGRRSGNFNKRHTPHYRQEGNKTNRNPGRESSQWNKREYHGRKQEGCDSAGYRGNTTKFQHHSEVNTGGHHYNNRGGALSVHSHYPTQPSQSGRHGDRSYEQISDEEPSSTAAGFKHQLAAGMLSISEASNSAISDNSNSGSGSDSELESNHSSASRPVSRASSVKSSSSRSNKERLYTRKERSSQRSRHHPYHHSKHNSTGYTSRRH